MDLGAGVSSVGGSQPWPQHRRCGSVGDLHGLELVEVAPVARGLWVLEADAPAVVLGSAQRHCATDVSVVRRSGGGAVLVDPRCSLWVDVVIAREDPLWVDDVGRSALWLGAVWAEALGSCGVTGGVHEGPADRHDLARAACFAGLGPGEVVAEGRKLVGISQRRTRFGARLQSIVYTSAPDPRPVVAALGHHAPGGLADALEARTGVVGLDPEVLLGAFGHAMMSLPPAASGT